MVKQNYFFLFFYFRLLEYTSINLNFVVLTNHVLLRRGQYFKYSQG